MSPIRKWFIQLIFPINLKYLIVPNQINYKLFNRFMQINSPCLIVPNQIIPNLFNWFSQINLQYLIVPNQIIPNIFNWCSQINLPHLIVSNQTNYKLFNWFIQINFPYLIVPNQIVPNIFNCCLLPPCLSKLMIKCFHFSFRVIFNNTLPISWAIYQFYPHWCSLGVAHRESWGRTPWNSHCWTPWNP